ncbi:GDCCVxC domain-containing (seleno)protein [Gemmatimonas sp.]|uniref:GDCCVxC domain-containing (seleno)protein n=1 Tax=Gemmatimonas sp. TaxID=1962908 RepID=UPI003569C4FB
MELISALTCPTCGVVERLAMPTDACVFFHECTACQTRLKPLAGDCCVFCSYGSTPCPPIQAGHTDCCASNPAALLPAQPLLNVQPG